jgi:hypothetical protein
LPCGVALALWVFPWRYRLPLGVGLVRVSIGLVYRRPATLDGRAGDLADECCEVTGSAPVAIEHDGALIAAECPFGQAQLGCHRGTPPSRSWRMDSGRHGARGYRPTRSCAQCGGGVRPCRHRRCAGRAGGCAASRRRLSSITIVPGPRTRRVDRRCRPSRRASAIAVCRRAIRAWV